MMNPSEQAEIRRRAQDGKEYLIAQIVEEAQRQSVQLSEVERKMLYFTETVETLPDIFDVNEQFESEYDDEEYEAKISYLLRHARKRVRKESPDGAQRWTEAERDLRREDHYLGVMVGKSHTAAGGFWTVAIWSTAITAAIFGAIVLWSALDDRHMIPAWMNRIPPRAWAWGAMAATLIFVLVLNGAFVNFRDFLARSHDFISFSFFRKRSDDNK
jgi:hypothetical protein